MPMNTGRPSVLPASILIVPKLEVGTQASAPFPRWRSAFSTVSADVGVDSTAGLVATKPAASRREASQSAPAPPAAAPSPTSSASTPAASAPTEPAAPPPPGAPPGPRPPRAAAGGAAATAPPRPGPGPGGGGGRPGWPGHGAGRRGHRLVAALIEPERRVAVGHQRHVGDDPEHPPVQPEDEGEEAGRVPRGEQQRHGREEHEQGDQSRPRRRHG